MPSAVRWCLYLVLFVVGLNILGRSGTSPGRTPTSLPRDVHGEISEFLTVEQCDAAFPDLYYEVDRAVSYWKDRHTIDRDDLQIAWRNNLSWPWNGGGVRFMIHDNELRILETAGFIGHPAHRSRGTSILMLIQRALEAASATGEVLPTIEAAIVVTDSVDYPEGDQTSSYWTWNANSSDSQQRHWLVPNFDFYTGGTLGSYREARRNAIAHDSPWISKIPQVMWRGTMWFNPVRQALLKVTQGKQWADVKPIDWKTKETFVPIDEMCKYAFNVHTEGGSYSGRLKFLLTCDTLTFIHDLEWRTYWYHLLIGEGPNQNYIPISRDFSDLEEKVEYYLEHPEEAERIVANSRSQFRDRYLTPAAQTCYLRKMIHGYSSVSFTPEVFKKPKGPDLEVSKRRGMAFEDFLASWDDFDAGVHDI